MSQPRPQRLVFGEVAELYDKARPSYPPPLVDHLVALMGRQRWRAVAPAGRPRVLDVGCGTGKAAVLLAGRGLGGVGLEPDLDMAAVARRNLAPFPTWSVSTGEFESYQPPPPGSVFDLITCGQAWHWLDPSSRVHQAARLLRPGGWLALFWNRSAEERSPLRQAIDEVYAELFPGRSGRGAFVQGRPAVEAVPPDAAFGTPSWRVFPWVRRYTTAEWLELIQTHSDHRMMEPGPRQVLLDRLAQVLNVHGGVYDHEYDCWLWTAMRV
jgi:SAM-dependent methyltransferase